MAVNYEWGTVFGAWLAMKNPIFSKYFLELRGVWVIQIRSKCLSNFRPPALDK
ncbi:hypothetical protein THIOM_004072 [Candidatus Thiomargarita nelsonii]|uniref:Uncharacterized protein n=1 Tax=Candidatus Thiomargarita nelsonii TaxID=1003181 RepID=A0A176RWS8_9GAMM|nr:hypothetical protein THIOM_004072 [Candidatus Thiomargarita nelsonii]